MPNTVHTILIDNVHILKCLALYNPLVPNQTFLLCASLSASPFFLPNKLKQYLFLLHS